jgi:hypothetical protein
VLPRVQLRLERFYRIAPFFPLQTDTWILVLERGADRGATAIDLIRHPARAFARDARGEERDEPEPPPRFPTRMNRRTLGIRLGQWGGGLDWEVELPPRARLQLDVGLIGMVSTTDMHMHAYGSRLVISVRRNGDFERLYREGFEVGKEWQPVEVDLSRHAGERLTLRVEIEVDEPVRRADLSWLGSPRIALPPAAEGEDAAGAQAQAAR